jgi:hypothetical protein
VRMWLCQRIVRSEFSVDLFILGPMVKQKLARSNKFLGG